MKKTIFIIMLCLFGCTNNCLDEQSEITNSSNNQIKEINIKDYDEGLGIGINENNFPDKEFIKYIKDNIDIDNNDYLSEVEIESTETIDITNNKVINNLSGLQFFINLKSLTCINCLNLEVLPISKLCNLEKLSLASIPIISLDLSNNRKLKILSISNTKISNLSIFSDVEDLHAYFSVLWNSITVDISNCPCFKNNIYEILYGKESNFCIDGESLNNTDNYIEIMCNDIVVLHAQNNFRKFAFGQGDLNINNSYYKTRDEAFDYGFNGNKWFEIVTHPYKDGTECTLKDCWTNPESCTYQYEVIVYDEQPF